MSPPPASANLVYAVTPDFVFVAADETGASVLAIDRTTQTLCAQGSSDFWPVNVGQLDAHFAPTLPAFGVVGVIRLLSGLHVILVTDRHLCGRIAGHDVWQLSAITIVSVARNLHHLSEAQILAESTYLSMLRHALGTPHFYFSYTCDFSMRLGAPSDGARSSESESFCWNQHLIRPLAAISELAALLLPITHGHVSVNPNCSVNGRTFTLSLVSRRSTLRAGKRFTRRGADTAGHVANYVETEQILEADGRVASFLMLRGSVPVLWDQQANLRYKPRIEINTQLPHLSACGRHFQSLLSQFEDVYAVNLIDQRGMEQQLGDLYLQTLSTLNNPHLRYHAFDFHKECRKLDWGRLDFLLNQVREDLNKFGWTLLYNQNLVVQRQTGVFRINCIDCLDRTNVVQSLFGRHILQRQLEIFGILGPGAAIASFLRLERLFKDIWADHADTLSLQYSGAGWLTTSESRAMAPPHVTPASSGSGALKTDFTRTGTRTLSGMVRDGVNSLQRYYMNNFSDGFCQDAIDLLLGNYVVVAGEGVSSPSPLADDPGLVFIRWAPLALLLCFVLLIFTVLMPPGSSLQFAFLLAVWLTGVLVFGRTIVVHGMDIVDQPRLVHHTLLHADGRTFAPRPAPVFSLRAILDVRQWLFPDRQALILGGANNALTGAAAVLTGAGAGTGTGTGTGTGVQMIGGMAVPMLSALEIRP